ncbi:MAG: hypothetical protein PSV40_06745 [Polaromonas sp.]|uniref:hypothetical protein n=1 Tax=Polaromonas sp. TaxID=1869339 RepID=UPI002488323D|nr:hypothetical protein [Polaromonas sp.]MDI1268785.1 hypothetical protein [Polaromonas sp.]
MYPVAALAQQIEREWAPELATYFQKTAEEVLSPVRPWFEFPHGKLRVELMDGSVVQFECALHLVSDAKRAIAVFTEHCGNHVYPYHEARVHRDGKLVYAQAV